MCWAPPCLKGRCSVSKTATTLLRYNKNVPRYTSYPTAPHFSETVGANTYANWLASLDQGETLSLYIHIPYCRTLCWYCGCNTKATKQYGPIEAYIDHLLQEADLVASHLRTRQRVSHIHFGGGSPSMLRPDDFSRIMAKIREHFEVDAGAEIAIEIDPRELTEPKVAAYAKAGVNRVSFGIQDFHADVQTAINRRQPFFKVYDAVSLVRSYGIEAINMDLLYGLPHQTVEKIQANIDFAHALKPSRIALFGYAHVPWMKKHMRLIDEAALPSGEERLEQFSAAAERLKGLGYSAIGLDHFVLPNDSMKTALERATLQRNFQGYTTDKATTLIGLGISAIGALPFGYVQSQTETRPYFTAIEAGKLPVKKGLILTEEDRLRRSIIEQLMCYFTVDINAQCKKHGLAPELLQESLQSLEPLQQDGLVTYSDGCVTVNDDARQAVRIVCSAFDQYLQNGKGKHAQVA